MSGAVGEDGYNQCASCAYLDDAGRWFEYTCIAVVVSDAVSEDGYNQCASCAYLDDAGRWFEYTCTGGLSTPVLPLLCLRCDVKCVAVSRINAGDCAAGN